MVANQKPLTRRYFVKENELSQFMDGKITKPRPKIKVEETIDNQVSEQHNNSISITSFSQLDQPPPFSVPAPSSETEKSDATNLKPEEQVPDQNQKPQASEQLAVSDSPTKYPNENLSSEEIKKWLESVKPETADSDYQMEKGRFPWGRLFFVFFFLLAIGALIGGVYFYQKTISLPLQQGIVETSTPTPISNSVRITPVEENDLSSKQTSTPTPQVSIDLSKFSIMIKNGTGIPGEAKKAGALLEAVGFAKATTGNSERFDFKDTEVATKASVPDSVFEAVKSALEKNYKSVVRSPQNLSDRQSYDIVITLGVKK
ncbi:MAG: LytR C-terminal domain-containing protein [Patescibacteria group bacterium]|nr:LytR C-terminal domain-containing protein [Patescibacteria group bacterium]